MRLGYGWLPVPTGRVGHGWRAHGRRYPTWERLMMSAVVLLGALAAAGGVVAWRHGQWTNGAAGVGMGALFMILFVMRAGWVRIGYRDGQFAAILAAQEALERGLDLEEWIATEIEQLWDMTSGKREDR